MRVYKPQISVKYASSRVAECVSIRISYSRSFLCCERVCAFDLVSFYCTAFVVPVDSSFQCRNRRREKVDAFQDLEDVDVPVPLGDPDGIPQRKLAIVADHIEFHSGCSVNDVLQGIFESDDNAKVVRELCDEVAQTWNSRAPTNEDGEMTFLYPYFDQLFRVVREAASGREMACLNTFHDHDAATKEKKRPDFALTRPCDREVGAFANCGYIEIKAPGKDLVPAIRQCLYHIAHQHRETDYTTAHGIGVATDGLVCVFVRVEFNEPNSVAMCKLSAPVQIFLGDGAAGPGLRGLIRLLCDTDATHHGLPNAPRLPIEVAETYKEQGLLGAGMFGVVYAVSNPENHEELLACKIPVPGRRQHLNHEEKALCALYINEVPRVPICVDAISRAGEHLRIALVTKPVGVRLVEHVMGVQGDQLNRDALIDELNKMFTDLSMTLFHAHRAQVCHGDVRASNIVFVQDQGFYLIDWGLAYVKNHVKKNVPPDYFVPETTKAHPSNVEKQKRKEQKDYRMLALTWLRLAFEPTAETGEEGADNGGGEEEDVEEAAGAGGRDSREPESEVSHDTPSLSRSANVSSAESDSRFSRSPWGEPHHAGDKRAVLKRRAEWWTSNWTHVERKARDVAVETRGVPKLISLLREIKEVDEAWLSTQKRSRSGPHEDQDSPSSKRPNTTPHG